MARVHGLSKSQCNLRLMILFSGWAGLLACDTNDFNPRADNEPIAGSGSFVFTAPDLSQDIRVFYYAPNNATPSSRIVMTLHGNNRDAESLRDQWIERANQFDLVVVAPWFTSSAFPGGSGYILGNVFANGNDPDGAGPQPIDQWAFSVIEPLFADVKRRSDNASTTYDLYGHSAGGQFAHRFVLFFPDGRYDRVVAANPGWYTVPDPSIAFPYGVDQSPIDSAQAAYFGRSLIILAGDRDTDPSSAGLRHTPEADAQGNHRFERAQHFFEQSQRLASNGPFEWRLEVVANIGHDGDAMGAAAAELLYR